MNLQEFTVKARLYFLIGLAVTAMAILEFMSLQNQRDALFENSNQKVKALVESAHTLIEGYASLAKTGEMTETEAKLAAKRSLENMSYANGEYFFILDYNAVVVAHGVD
ncbi:cache domain-containing protein, partial [Oceanospirillum multiglobuliferum]